MEGARRPYFGTIRAQKDYCFCRELVVHANIKRLHIRCVHARHGVVVEWKRIAEGIELVWLRQQGRDLDGRGVQQAGRDDVVRKWRAHERRRERIVYWSAAWAKQTREIATALAVQRNTGDHRLSAVSDGALVVGEKEGFVVPDRAAHRSAELVVAESVLGLAGLVREEVGRVQRVVAKELKQRSVPTCWCRISTAG